MITHLRRLLARLRPKAPPRRVIIINAHTRRYELILPPPARRAGVPADDH